MRRQTFLAKPLLACAAVYAILGLAAPAQATAEVEVVSDATVSVDEMLALA